MKPIDKIIDVPKSILFKYLFGGNIAIILIRILDPIFSMVVASHIFEYFYFKYSIINITEYSQLIKFILNGEFVIPLSLVFTVHITLLIFSGAFHNFCTTKINILISKYLSNTIRNDLNKNLNRNGSLTKLKISLRKLTQINAELEFSFLFLVKSIILTIWIYCSMEMYGTFLFILMQIFLLVGILLNLFLYVLLGLLPNIIESIENPEKDINLV